ncbi:bestrophin family ion channel [Synechococcus sp. YX-04-1]|uniref:bestrophin family ion channel n=1 Tax=Synechococcus sp. YX-04-1 TaxID=3062778 RepID=UPI0026E3C297|nr:bestrophin family ion channel [Synechococcus sp. YX-04-1]MDO6352535.1 bestrophin family ion channel [Synechococcus sp. YX-04-1]
MAFETGSYGNPAATNQRDYWRVTLQLVKRAKVDLAMLVLMSAVLIPLDIHLKDWLLSTRAVAVLGIAMSIFIGFRNTQAISRWWEARTLWGTVVNKSRVWADGLRGLLSEQQWRSERTQQLVQLQVAIVWQLNFQLRNFWHPDLQLMRQQLLDQLALPDDSTVRSLSVQRMMGIQKLAEDQWIHEWGRKHLLEISDAMTDAVGGLERIRNTPIPPPYDLFVRVINWVFGTQLLLSFESQGSALTGILLFFGFLIAERIGAYVEGPFDQDGSSFSMPLNTICVGISEDLMPRELNYGRYRPSRNPVFWD